MYFKIVFIAELLAIHLAFGIQINNGHSDCKINNRPIIGVMNHYLANGRNQFVASSYVKWLESAGARVVPIFNDQSDKYYHDLMSKINGALLPGGDSSLKESPYAKTAEKILNIAIELNQNGTYFPVWATCLGFEKMVSFFLDDYDWLEECHTYNVALSMDIVDSVLANLSSVRMFRNMKANDKDLLDIIQHKPVMAHYHVYCLTLKKFIQSNKLTDNFHLIGTNLYNHFTFVSLMEHQRYPFYTSIWHPEMIQFEWVIGDDVGNHNHDYDSVRVAQFFGNFFVNETRKNCGRFANKHDEQNYLIYNFNKYMVYQGKQTDGWYEEIYEFPGSFK